MDVDVTLEENTPQLDKNRPPTPLPVLPLFVLCCIILSESFSITMIFPFLADMVMDFGLVTDEGEIGFYAGWIASSFNIAQFSSSFGWGKLSDHVGRRPVLLIGLAGNALMIFLFGWSKDLWYAILARSLNGFLNGNVGVVKTYLGEITDDTNAAKGFSIFGLCWSTGLIIGPSLGGFLSKPGEKAPHIFPPDSLFHDFPYLLPCLVSCFVTTVGFVTGFFFLKETVHNRKKDADSEEKPLISKDPNSNVLEVDQDKPTKGFLIFKLFMIREVAVTSFLYALLCFYRMMLDEIFAIWAPLKGDEGGLDYSSNDIGMMYAISGAAGLVAQLFLFQPAIKRLGSLFLYRFASLGQVLFLMGIPLVNLLVPSGYWSVWATIAVLFMYSAVLNNFLFVGVMMLVNNSSDTTNMGAVNGFAQTWASLLRAIAPSVAGTLLAWSLTNGLGFPFNHYFTFIIMSLFALVCFGLTFLLDKSIQHKKEKM